MFNSIQKQIITIFSVKTPKLFNFKKVIMYIFWPQCLEMLNLFVINFWQYLTIDSEKAETFFND